MSSVLEHLHLVQGTRALLMELQAALPRQPQDKVTFRHHLWAVIVKFCRLHDTYVSRL